MTAYGNQINISEPIKMTESEKDFVKSFDCGNESINEYLKEKSFSDPQTVTFIFKDIEKNKVICYYSLSCSGLVADHNYGNKISIYPAVEIKMFATDEQYQHIPYSDNNDDGVLSDMLLAEVIYNIYKFTDNQCGADKIVLYAVPEFVNFYSRNGFCEFKEFMIPSTNWYIDGCIPMYMDL